MRSQALNWLNIAPDKMILMYQITDDIKWGWVWSIKYRYRNVSYTYLDLLAVIYSSRNKIVKVDNFAVILMKVGSPKWYTISETVCGKFN